MESAVKGDSERTPSRREQKARATRRAVLRAAVTNVEQMGSGRRAIGASTITQQVAKNMLVGNDRTMMRKVREAILAQRIEAAMPKDRILEIYLNEIYLGAEAAVDADAGREGEAGRAGSGGIPLRIVSHVQT